MLKRTFFLNTKNCISLKNKKGQSNVTNLAPSEVKRHWLFWAVNLVKLISMIIWDKYFCIKSDIVKKAMNI